MFVLLSACATREAGLEVVVRAEVVKASSNPARLTLTSVRGVSCFEFLAQRLSPISTAWAHGAHTNVEASPLHADVDVSFDLTQPSQPNVATLHPPPGTWCALEVTFGPSPSSEPWGGTTLLVDVAGRRYLSTGTRSVQLPFMARTLSASSRRLDLLMTIDATALTTLDPAAPDARRELLDTLLASLSVSTSESPE